MSLTLINCAKYVFDKHLQILDIHYFSAWFVCNNIIMRVEYISNFCTKRIGAINLFPKKEINKEAITTEFNAPEYEVINRWDTVQIKFNPIYDFGLSNMNVCLK